MLKSMEVKTLVRYTPTKISCDAGLKTRQYKLKFVGEVNNAM